MKMKSQTTPELRFPGFTGDVETHPLGTVTKVIDCKHRTPEYVEKGVPIVSPGTIRWGEIDLISPTKRVTEAEYVSLMDHCDPQIGDMVLSRNQSLGIASRITSNEKFVLGQDTVLLQQKDGNGGIVFYRLQTSGTQDSIAKLSGGSTFARINLKDIRLLPLSLPADRAEQRKIADFLTAVDGRIGQLSQKKALLEDYKKGVMQQLFTQALRFKDDHGHEFPDWEEKRVEDMFQVTRGKVLAMPETQSEPTGEFRYPVYSSQTKANGLAGYFNKFLFRDAITWTTDGANAGDVKLRRGEFYCTNVCGVLLSDKGYANEFVAAMLGTVTRKHVSYVGNPKLMNNVMSQISISVPSSLAEQTKIANFLSALDRKIESVAQQTTHTQAFKQGLLQQMFV